MKTLITALLLLITSFSFSAEMFGETKQYGAPFYDGDFLIIISDEAVTSSNDTLVSSWYEVSGYTQVEFLVMIDDTCRVDYQVDYGFFPYVSSVNGAYLTVAGVGTDSIVTKGSAVEHKIKGVIVRGYGTSAITNLIPGANYVRIRCYRFAGASTEASEATNELRVGLKRTE